MLPNMGLSLFASSAASEAAPVSSGPSLYNLTTTNDPFGFSVRRSGPNSPLVFDTTGLPFVFKVSWFVHRQNLQYNTHMHACPGLLVVHAMLLLSATCRLERCCWRHLSAKMLLNVVFSVSVTAQIYMQMHTTFFAFEQTSEQDPCIVCWLNPSLLMRRFSPMCHASSLVLL